MYNLLADKHFLNFFVIVFSLSIFTDNFFLFAKHLKDIALVYYSTLFLTLCKVSKKYFVLWQSKSISFNFLVQIYFLKHHFQYCLSFFQQYYCKTYFIIDQQIAQHFVHYGECLPSFFYTAQMINPEGSQPIMKKGLNLSLILINVPLV